MLRIYVKKKKKQSKNITFAFRGKFLQVKMTINITYYYTLVFGTLPFLGLLHFIPTETIKLSKSLLLCGNCLQHY